MLEPEQIDGLGLALGDVGGSGNTVDVDQPSGVRSTVEDSSHGVTALELGADEWSPEFVSGSGKTHRRWVAAQLDLRVQQLEQATEVAVAGRGRKPVTFLNPTEGLADALPESSLLRLRRLKEELDPTGLFRGNFSTE